MIYKEYKKLADYLGTLLGENTEVVLHDFTNLEHSIVYIVNSHITNRKIGDTVTDLLLEFLQKNKDIPDEFLCNYVSKSKNGKKLYSSTYFIYGDNKELIGALCTNTDYSDYNEAITLLKSLLPNSLAMNTENNESEEPIRENFYNDFESLTLNKIQEEIERLDISPNRMTPDEKMSVVHSLNDMGMFMLKGSVPEAAKRLNSSEATIYRYIRMAKKTNK